MALTNIYSKFGKKCSASAKPAASAQLSSPAPSVQLSGQTRAQEQSQKLTPKKPITF